jgi:hypothetical protein
VPRDNHYPKSKRITRLRKYWVIDRPLGTCPGQVCRRVAVAWMSSNECSTAAPASRSYAQAFFAVGRDGAMVQSRTVSSHIRM